MLRETNLSLAVHINGQPYLTACRVTQPSAHMLTIHTAIPAVTVGIEIHSVFVGHPRTRTHATHLLLGPIGAENQVVVEAHDASGLQPAYQPRACVYEHIAQLIGLLNEHGYQATAKLPDLAYAALPH